MQDTAAGQMLVTMILSGCDAIHKLMDRTGATLCAAGDEEWPEHAQAAVDILEDLGATFAQLREALKGSNGPETVIAVRDTLRLVEVNRAAETGREQPVRRDATRKGLERLIERKRQQLAHMERTVTEHTGIPRADLSPAETIAHPVAGAWRRVRRDLDVLVEAWDAM